MTLNADALRAEYQLMTVQQHILQEQKRFPGVSGEFSWLLSGITLATKMIQAKVRRAGLTEILGVHGETNVQGEMQQKLDVYANEALAHCLSVRESIGILASEENEQPIMVHNNSPAAKYAVVFDPLDGSSNIDVNVSVGTTFSILRRPEGADLNDHESWILQPGHKQIAAGYVVYGSSTILVYSAGNGVHGFTLDPAIGAYILSHPNMRMPEQGKYYSVNEAYRDEFPTRYGDYIDRLRRGTLGHIPENGQFYAVNQGYYSKFDLEMRRYIDHCSDLNYSLRYIGSMVADFHRTLLKGGVFLYPPTKDHTEGKLRLLYEANPVAFLAEQAGGTAIDGTRRVLDIVPTSVHQRTPLIVGSRVELADFERFVTG